MTPGETLILTRFVKAACPQQAIDEFTPDAWHDLLSEVRFEDAREAVRTICRKQPFIAPAEIIDEVRRIRAKRLHEAPPLVPPDLDPIETIAWLAEARHRIADGDEVPDTARGELKPRHLPDLRELTRKMDNA